MEGATNGIAHTRTATEVSTEVWAMGIQNGHLAVLATKGDVIAVEILQRLDFTDSQFT
ncbi:hypothetical protein D3C80_1212850 [compost metagenome]